MSVLATISKNLSCELDFDKYNKDVMVDCHLKYKTNNISFEFDFCIINFNKVERFINTLKNKQTGFINFKYTMSPLNDCVDSFVLENNNLHILKYLSIAGDVTRIKLQLTDNVLNDFIKLFKLILQERDYIITHYI